MYQISFLKTYFSSLVGTGCWQRRRKSELSWRLCKEIRRDHSFLQVSPLSVICCFSASWTPLSLPPYHFLLTSVICRPGLDIRGWSNGDGGPWSIWIPVTFLFWGAVGGPSIHLRQEDYLRSWSTPHLPWESGLNSPSGARGA